MTVMLLHLPIEVYVFVIYRSVSNSGVFEFQISFRGVSCSSYRAFSIRFLPSANLNSLNNTFIGVSVPLRGFRPL